MRTLVEYLDAIAWAFWMVLLMVTFPLWGPVYLIWRQQQKGRAR